jgi:hypothetical protein
VPLNLSVPTNVIENCPSEIETDEHKLHSSVHPGHQRTYRGYDPPRTFVGEVTSLMNIGHIYSSVMWLHRRMYVGQSLRGTVNIYSSVNRGM